MYDMNNIMKEVRKLRFTSHYCRGLNKYVDWGCQILLSMDANYG